jgi:hypothetical protein
VWESLSGDSGQSGYCRVEKGGRETVTEDDVQLATQHIDELGKSIDAGSPQELTYHRQLVKMPNLHHFDGTPVSLRRPSETEPRLPLAMSAVVITGLSAPSWAVVITIVVALQAVL